MQGRPLLILLPVRNGAAYISQTIESVIGQTNRNWRLIILENSSSDDTLKIVSDYSDERISLQPAERDLGMRENWQRALTRVQPVADDQTLMSFIGHDDRLMPSFVDQIFELESDHPQATLFQTHFDLIDQDGALIRPCRPVPLVENSGDLASQLCWGLRDSFGTGFAFRVRDYIKVGGWPDLPRLLFADHLLFIRLANLGYKVASPGTGAAYRLHTGSASGQLTGARLKDTLHALDLFIGALHQELPDYITSDHGRNAIAALLSRELEILSLAAVTRLYGPEEREVLKRLEILFAERNRGLPPVSWSKLKNNRLQRIDAKARRALASYRIWRATR